MDQEKNQKEDGLRFKPLNSGLGFHPFSEGLPYASKTAKPELKLGTGAMSAGAPRFAFPIKKVESKPIITQPNLTTHAQQTTQKEIKKIALSQTSTFTELFLRATAYLVDMAFNFAVTLGLLILAQAGSPSISLKDLIFGDFAIILFMAFLVLNYVLITSQELIFRTSIGKSLFSFGLKGTTGQVILRAIFFVPSVFFCGLGILWALFDSERICWHDRASGLTPKRYS